jgi:hypothetical protein
VVDNHVAEAPIVDAIEALAQELPEIAPVGHVGSYRSDDLHRRHPLRASVAEWSRLPSVARTTLAPLADDDVREGNVVQEHGQGFGD